MKKCRRTERGISKSSSCWGNSKRRSKTTNWTIFWGTWESGYGRTNAKLEDSSSYYCWNNWRTETRRKTIPWRGENALIIHREANATLLGRKILVVCDRISKRPTRLATKGRDNAQYMIVDGGTKPAFAVIDVKLRWIKER